MQSYSDKLRRQLENKWKDVMDRMWGQVDGTNRKWLMDGK
jgi:hypothetical protein